MSNTIKEFTQELARRVSEQLGENRFIVRSNVVRKVNLELTALSIIDKEGDSNISPQVYVNGYYHQYLNSNLEYDDIVNAIIRTYEESKPDEKMDMTFFTDWEQVKFKVVPRIINTEWNKELLEDVPHFDVLDLSVCFYVIVSMDKNGMGSILVRNEHLALWNITLDELKKTAFEQNKVFNKAQLESMYNVMKGMLSEQMSGDLELSEDDLEGMIDALVEEDCEMFVISNNERMFGAIELLDTELLEKLSQKLESDLCLIGSSVHEIIAVKAERSSAEIFAEMIQTVNEEQVEVSERLTNIPYFYKRGSRQIEIM